MDNARQTPQLRVTAGELHDVFFWGANYGQLLMEQERESEETFDAFVCGGFALKMGVPSAPMRRRAVHSEKWFAAKAESKEEFIEFIKTKRKEAEKNAGD